MLRALMLGAILTTGVSARADEALRRTSVFVEGEDFVPTGPEWVAGEGWRDDIYEANSGNAVLANDGGKGEATKDVVIPADGTYNAWVRYLKVGAYAGTFGLRVEQNGQVALDAEYRTKPEGADWKPMWEKFEAGLVAGPAKLTLYIKQPGIRQRIDCVLLTPNLTYEPNYRDFAPQVFLRVRLIEPEQAVSVRVSTYQHRAPVWYGEPGTIGATGLGSADPLPPDTWSPWVEISPWMDADKWLTTVKLRFMAGDKPLPSVKADLQVAPEPDEAQARTFSEDLDGEIVSLSLPGNLRKYPDLPALASELSARHLATAKALGLPPLPLVGAERALPKPSIQRELWISGWGNSFRSRKILALEMETTRLLGASAVNDLYGVRREIGEGLGIKAGFMSQWVPYQAWGCPMSPDLPKMMDDHFARIAADIRAEDPEGLARCYRNILQDEPGTSDLKHLAECPHCSAAFRTFLREHGLTPADFGAATWDALKPVPRDQATDAPTRRLHYWSIEYRDWTNARLVREGRLAAEKHLGSHILNCVNFTDGPLSGWGAGMIEGPDWFLFGRMGSVSQMWSEDWATLGPEVSGYITDMLRAAARPGNLPVGEYIICNHNPTLEQRAFSALMHGARTLHFYCYGPYYAFADGMVSDNPETQATLARTLRKIAAADDCLKDARLPKAEVAILYGKSHEVWQEDSAVNTERRSTYLALQQAHLPTDILCEQDIADGVLDAVPPSGGRGQGVGQGYKALYVTESNLRRDAAAKIIAWVQAGGGLHLGAGAAVRDEYNEPLPDLLDLAGVKVTSVDKPAGDYREHYGLHYTAPKGEVSLTAGDLWPQSALPLLGYRETSEATTAQVLAQFADGSPAVYLNKAGAGSVLRFAFMPGLGYAKSADPGPDRLTVGYKPEQLPVLTAAARLAGVTPTLTIDSLLVEAQLLHGPREDALVLANWSGGPLADVRIAIPGKPVHKSARALSGAKVALSRDAKGISLSLPLDATDVVILTR
ncbi:MAG: hypothetical protein FJX75_03590 [Armatimonadetes bacterium]|nr:hypothetical protein [Armatimonadota bacterium]